MTDKIIQFRCPEMISNMNYRSGANPEVLVRLVDDTPKEVICPEYLDNKICACLKSDYEIKKSLISLKYREDSTEYSVLKERVSEETKSKIDKNTRLDKKQLENLIKNTLFQMEQDELVSIEKINQKCILSQGFKGLI